MRAAGREDQVFTGKVHKTRCIRQVMTVSLLQSLSHSLPGGQPRTTSLVLGSQAQ